MGDEEHLLEDLRRDLQDGDDLSMAVSLVSDAVQRRVRRVRRSLDLLDPDDAGSEALRRRLQMVLDRYQSALDLQSDGLERIIDDFQPTLADLADELADGVSERGNEDA